MGHNTISMSDPLIEMQIIFNQLKAHTPIELAMQKEHEKIEPHRNENRGEEDAYCKVLYEIMLDLSLKNLDSFLGTPIF